MLAQRESDTRFSNFKLFHVSVSPGPLSIPLGPFLIFMKIRGDIRYFVFIAGVKLFIDVNDTGEKARMSR